MRKNLKKVIHGDSEYGIKYEEMKEQVLRYGGFFVGRYEAGDNNYPGVVRGYPLTEEMDEQLPTFEKGELVVRKGVSPFNWTSCWLPKEYEEENKYNALSLVEDFYKNSDSVEATLCYKNQFYAISYFIGKIAHDEPDLLGLGVTGNDHSDKNIYDLAGNCTEWQMPEKGDIQNGTGEYLSGTPEYRGLGPAIDFDIIASGEDGFKIVHILYEFNLTDYNDFGYGSYNITFRPTLYIKK